MAKLNAFIFTTLNGFYHGAGGDIRWHRHGEEENQYASESMKGGGILLFGRKTYDLMASYWPTPMALQNDPKVAEGMNRAEKVVFSRTMKKADWANTRVLNGDLGEEARRLKRESPKDMVLLGSGHVLTQLADLGLVDEYLVMVDPVALGEGGTLLKGLKSKLDLKLTSTRAFKSGVVLLSYEPMGKV